MFAVKNAPRLATSRQNENRREGTYVTKFESRKMFSETKKAVDSPRNYHKDTSHTRQNSTSFSLVVYKSRRKTRSHRIGRGSERSSTPRPKLGGGLRGGGSRTRREASSSTRSVSTYPHKRYVNATKRRNRG